MKRILLTGITGQVGQELLTTLAPLGDVIGVGRNTLDLTQANAIRSLVAEVQPDLIINPAAYTAVDRAESDLETAMAINATAPRVFAEAVQSSGAGFIHLSTDYVFDGSKNTPYTEDDPPNPLGAYGQSKLLGERGVQECCDRYTIIRTAWVYGCFGQNNFVKTMLRLGAERDEIRVVADQIGTPTWARNLADTIACFATHHLQAGTSATLSPDVGLFHYTNSGTASWYDFAVAIFEEAKSLGFPLKVRRVIPITTADYPTPAKRPAYSILSGQKTTPIVGTHATHWRQGLRQMLIDFYSNTYESNCSRRR